jgi:hypothetical protein
MPAPTEPTTRLPIVELSEGGNEASDLLPVTTPAVLASHGWQRAFWTVLDEGAVERSIALIGQRKGASSDTEGWEIHPLKATPEKDEGRTEDAEACARSGDWIYVVGSHYGSKAGPLEPKRAFVARFSEPDLDEHIKQCRPGVGIVRNAFRLHRAINDALAAADLDLVAVGPHVREAFLDATIARGEKKGKKWSGRVRPEDLPLNIEGAAFRPSGTLLLALRFPVAADGRPVLVELAGIEKMFDDPPAWPVVQRVWRVEGEDLAPGSTMTGFRALSARGADVYDAILGSLDATGKDSALLEDFPDGGDVPCSHWRLTLGDTDVKPAPGAGGPPVGTASAELVRAFPDLRNVEGLAGSGGDMVYVTDEDRRIALRFA